MSLQSLVPFLHVLAAVFLFGHALTTPFVIVAIREAPTPSALWPWLRFARDSARLNPLAALLLLATGIWLGSGRWSEGWLQVACALFVVSSALAVGVVKGTGQRLAALAASADDAAISPAVDALRRSPRWTLAASLIIANQVCSLLLMYAQPGLLSSVAVTVAANAGVLALRALRDRKVSTPAPGIPTAA